ncbi:MAG: hypothetical protein ABI443_10305 [Chthoniobacterales bacterium]
MNDKPRYRFWKIAVSVLLSLIGLMVLYLVLRVVWIRHSGHRQWEHTKADLLSRGEKLSLMDFVPATIPDEQNFFADPIWRELNDFVEIEQGGHRVKKSRIEEGKKQIDQFNAPLNKEEIALLKKQFPEIQWSKDNTTFRSIANSVVYSMDGQESRFDKKNKAEFLRTILSPLQPLLNHIAELAKRPYAQYPVDYENNIRMNLRHISPLLQCSQILRARAEANLILGNSQSAFDDVMLMFHLEDTLKTEPVLISLLVRGAIIENILRVIDNGLKGHAWTNSNLADFEKQLSEYHLIHDLTFVIRAERGGFNDCIEGITKRAGAAKVIVTMVESKEMPIHNKFSLEVISALYSEPDKAFYNRFIQQWVETLDVAPKKGLKEESFFQEIREIRSHMVKYPYLLSQQALPGLIPCEVKMARRQDQVIQAQIACALERYWLKNKLYPEALVQLTPDYIPTIPNDIVTLQPMRYRLIAPDQYQLWSIGWDHIDDDGKPATSWEQGDWVWGQWKLARKY